MVSRILDWVAVKTLRMVTARATDVEGGSPFEHGSLCDIATEMMVNQ